jgi:energy-coupling factor transporter ATP-binding protein EcfA2
VLWNLKISGTRGQQRTPRSYDGKSKEWLGAAGFLRERLPRILYFPNFLFELPDRFKLTESDEEDRETRDKNRFYRLTFSQILDNAASGADLETHVIDRLKSTDRADQRSLDSILLEMARLITETVFGGWDRILGHSSIAQGVELRADIENEDAYLELKIKGPDGYYDLSERSLGFRWFFMFLLMTSFQGRSLNGTKPLLLLDEPASNLHSSAQAELLKSFENLLDKCNLVYATHSHHLINLKWLDSAYVIRNAGLGSLDFSDYVSTNMPARTLISATKYRRFVAEHPDQTSYFQPVLDLLDYKPSALEPVPNVILVEGKSDFFMLKYVTEVLGLQPSVHLVPGGGAGALDPLIRLYIGWAKSFIILLDGDAEGRRQRERYMSEFGVLLRDRCVLLPEVTSEPQIKGSEGLLTDDEKQQVMDAVFASNEIRPGEKKALLQSLLELYARKEAVQLSDSTKERFQRLLSTLNSRLEELDL